jgi:hypothetical protein
MLEAGEIDDLMFAYFDRAFRSGAVKREVVDRVEDLGGRVLTLDMGAISHATAIQWVTSELMSVVNEYVARSARERSGAAQVMTIREGKAIMTSIPPGYRRGDDKRLVVDEDEAKIIRRAFEIRAGGGDAGTYDAVRTYLREQGIRHEHRGVLKPYSIAGVRKLLMSRVYRGELHHGCANGGRDCAARPEAAGRHNLSAHPAIVDEPLWRRAQRPSPSKGRKSLEPRLLSKLGVAVCGTCGARMSLSSVVVDGKRYPFYRCGAEQGDCKRRAYIAAGNADAEVIAELRRLFGREIIGQASSGVDVDAARAALDTAQHALDAKIRLYAAAGVVDEPSAVEEITVLREARDDAEIIHDRLARVAARTRAVTVDERRLFVQTVFETIRVMPGRGPGRLRFKIFPEQTARHGISDAPADSV